MALGAFGLTGKVNYSTLHYRVRKARAKGTYDLARTAFVTALVADCAKKNQDIGGLVVIDLTKNNTDGANSLDLSSMSTGTMVTLATAGSSEVLSISSESPKKKKQSRKTFRQASLEKLETKRTKTDYDSRYKAAFKDATNIVAAARVASDVTGDEESVLGMLDRLNSLHKLDEKKKKLAKTTVYRAVDEGRAGMSPLKKRSKAKNS